MIICCAFDLQPALNAYAANLSVSCNELDTETFNQDNLTPNDWDDLALIKDYLVPLFYLTKDLEDNTDLQEDRGKASYSIL